eukprot:555727_1
MASEEDETRIKIITVGDGAVGKTCLLTRFVTNEFPTAYIPIVCDNTEIDKQYIMDDITIDITLDLWDTVGQSEFDAIRPLAYRDADIVLFCFSLANRSSFGNICQKWVPEIEHHLKEPFKVLVGTKCDCQTDHVLLVFGYVHQ